MPYIAPNSPVADWRCVPQGVGYGNYFDPVTGTWATVTRTTPKTARTADGRIVDVPAGYLALEPWSLHKTGGVGLAAIIEEARTNLIPNSSFEADSNGDGIADGFSVGGGWGTASHVASRAGGVHGDYAQRVICTGDGSSKTMALVWASAFGAVSEGESLTLSFYVREFANSGTASPVAVIRIRDGSNAEIGVAQVAITGTGRVALTYSNLPAGSSRVIAYMLGGPIISGTCDITIDACQLEKGAFATSYIPTTTAAVTRNADVPVGVDASTGTQVIVRSGANLATPSAVSTFTGDPAAAMLNRAVQRIALYDATLTAGQLAATTDLLAGLDTARITNEVTL